MNPVTERIANMNWVSIILVMAILFGVWFALRKNNNKHIKSFAETCNSLAVALGLVFLVIRPFIIQAFYIPSESMIPTLLVNDQIMANKFIYRFIEPKFKDVVIFKAPPEASEDKVERDFVKRVIGVPGDVVKIIPGRVKVGDSDFMISELNENLRGLPENSGNGRVKLTKTKIYVDGTVVKESDVAAALLDDPNAKVTIFPGGVYINGKRIEEPYTAEDCDSEYPNLDTDTKYIIKDKNGDSAVKIPKGKLLVMGDNRNASLDARSWGLLDRSRIEGKAMFIFYPLKRIRIVK
jgi:signal peptidase I